MIGPITSLSNSGNKELFIRYDEDTTRSVEVGGWETLQAYPGTILIVADGQVIAEITYPDSSSFSVKGKAQIEGAKFDLVLPLRS